MQRIGLVLHISSNHNMILKAENLPHIGDQVIDENLNPAGNVFDIIGPVTSPYITVRPNVEAPSRFVEHVLYTTPSLKPRREKRKR